MPKHRALEVCDCSICINKTYQDEYGDARNGSLQRRAVIKAHHREDEKLRILRRQQEESDEATILLAALADPDKPQPASHLDDEDIQMYEVPPEAPLSAGPSHIGLHNCTPQAGPSDDDRAFYQIVSSIQSTLAFKTRRLPVAPRLSFVTKPTALDDPPGALDPRHASSLECITFAEWLQAQIAMICSREMSNDRDLNGRCAALLKQLKEQADRVKALVKRQWDMEKVCVGLFGGTVDESVNPINIDTTPFFRAYNTEPFILAALFLATALHTLASVSRVEAACVLAVLRSVIYSVFLYRWASSRTATLTTTEQALLDDIPRDIRSALKRLNLEPEYTLYACCPSCFALYPPNPKSPAEPYPELCTFQSLPASEICGATLLKKTETGSSAPIKTFAYQSLHEWIGRLLSRCGVEELIEKSWQRAPQTNWSDIMDAPAIRRFLGPDNETLFSLQPDGALPLVFSLFVDWFNPFGNKQAGKSHSVGAIYMCCLNLPPNLRYRSENIYLAGIIPGPTEPSLEQINHFLSVLVNDLLALWEQGLILSKTASRPFGRFVRAAFIPLICDLPALRKTAGFASHSSMHTCSFCHMQKTDLNNIDTTTWEWRTVEEHMEAAVLWRDARDIHERDRIFDQHGGIRWSELLRLPYWNPTRYALVDAMHNLYLGELRHHCMSVLGVNTKTSTASKVPPHTPDEQRDWLEYVARAIRKGSESAVGAARKGYVVAVAQLNNVSPDSGSNKRDYSRALIKWHKETNVLIKVPEPLDEPTADYKLLEKPSDYSNIDLLSGPVLTELRQVINKTCIPSWMSHPPRNFGKPSHGKLKADQWRSLCTVHMVITLVRLWGRSTEPPRHRAILSNFIHLVLAINVGTRHSLSSQRAAAFDFHMRQYLLSLREIFDHDLVPNHHLSLHLQECMELFGPVHAWWSFPFERFNGLIAQLKTNNKPDQIPSTFLRYFCMGSNLRWLMSTVSWPDVSVFHQMRASFREAFGDAVRGIPGLSPDPTSPFTYDDKREFDLDDGTYTALLDVINGAAPCFASASSVNIWTSNLPLLPTRAQAVKKVDFDGLTFGSAKGSLRNSFVMFRQPDGSVRAGQIRQVFYHRRREGLNPTHVEPFFVIRPYIPLSSVHAKMDPFRQFEELNAELYYHKSTTHVVVRKVDIVSHFAAFVYVPDDIQEECILALSLDRS